MLLRHTRRILLLAVPVLGCALLLATPAGAALMNPTAPVLAPPKVETFSPYLPQMSCDPVAKAGTEALRALVVETYGARSVGITRQCHVGGRSEHKEGRALDWMLNASDPADVEIADHFLSWLLEAGPDGVDGYNARRLGVMYVIWNRQTWSSYAASSGWKPYTGVSPHTDHIHISLSWSGAMKRTSFWTGEAAPIDYGPCRTYVGLPADAWTAPRTTPSCPAQISPLSLTGSPLLQTGSTGPYVAQVQLRLKVTGDGVFGSKTAAALTAFQTAQGLPATGRTDVTTWARLRTPVVVAAPKPAPVPAPVATPVKVPAAAPTVGTPAPAAVTAPVNKALAPYAGVTLKQGARGAAVVALQKALRITADGAFGPKTAAAVLAFHKTKRLKADAVVRPATWAALGAPAPLPAKAAGRRWLPAAR